MTEPAPGIRAVDVYRLFGDVAAVAGMDVEALPGEVTALVGPNGAGKTTLLLILATLLTPNAGQVTVAGYDPVVAPREVRARLGWMPDAFGTYDTLTAREVLEFVAASYRLTPVQGAARARELLALVHLEEFAERPVHVLSRGQKQRLGLARAIVHEPSVLLLDEPASGLDPRSRIELRTILRGLAAAGCALLVSSHILSELEEMADRAVFVAGGRTVSTTLVADLRSAPLGAMPWRIRALDPLGLIAALTRLRVEHDAADPGAVQVSLQGEQAAADLLDALVREGVRIVAFAPTGSALETAYLAMTQERL
ncbi:MAG: ABC transporter ATP-binding protein [Sporichthyaceae bacterium]